MRLCINLCLAMCLATIAHLKADVIDPPWQPLITKSSFPDWSMEGESNADFRLQGNMITGQPIGNNPKNAFLCSPSEYRNFELRFSFRINPASLNSGVQFRSEVTENNIVAGPQLEMDVQSPQDMSFFMRHLADKLVRLSDNPWRLTLWPAGGVYGEALETGWIYPGVAGGDKTVFATAGERLTRPDSWNDLRLLARGPHVQTWLNGEPRADYQHGPTDKPGKICLQVHGGNYENPADYAVIWRELEIRVLE
ncbi:MAG: DUF1080 domain-containing protein [Pseudomonadota bacterium]